MPKLFLLSSIGLSILVVFSRLSLTVPITQPKALAAATELSPTPAPRVPIPDVPANLYIPAIALHSAVVPVNLTDKKIVDVPDALVGWWEGGARPGERGNAVLDGHFLDPNLNPGVFNNLNTLRVGDDIRVSDAKSRDWNFKVTGIETVPAKDFPVQKVYGKSENHTLVLITCAGTYDKNTGTYTNRTIVYAQKTD